MQNADSSSLFDDLDAALQSGSSEKRVAMLRRVTDLFLSEAGRLTEFARSRRHEETAVALSLLSSAPLEIVKPLMNSPMDEGLSIPCKVADCRWGTVNATLATKLPPGSVPKAGCEKLKTEFANYRSRMPSDCLDSGRSARQARGAPDTVFNFIEPGLQRCPMETEKTSASISNAASPFTSWGSMEPGVGTA